MLARKSIEKTERTSPSDKERWGIIFIFFVKTTWKEGYSVVKADYIIIQSKYLSLPSSSSRSRAIAPSTEAIPSVSMYLSKASITFGLTNLILPWVSFPYLVTLSTLGEGAIDLLRLIKEFTFKGCFEL